MWAYIIAGSFAILVIVIIYFIYFIRNLFGSTEYYLSSESDPEYNKRREGEYPPTYPNGWLPIFESMELAKGQCKSISALGKDLVLFRGTSGKVHVLDAYCPHLGANLGVGGTVVGDQIKCAFHGWQFNGEGQTTFIPGTDCKSFSSVRVKPYESVEINGFIFLWNHSEGKDPNWVIEEVKEIANLKYLGKLVLEYNCHVLDIFENEVDLVHFTHLHQTKVNINFKALKEPESQTDINTEHTFFGILQVNSRYLVKNYGLGHYSGILEVGNYRIPNLTAVITLGPMRQRVVLHFYSKSSLIDIIVGKIMQFWVFTISKEDKVIHNNRTYRRNPPFAKNELTSKQFRRWAQQFYSVLEAENVPEPTSLDECNDMDQKVSFSGNDFC